MEEARWVYRFLVLDLLVLVAASVVGSDVARPFHERVVALKRRVEGGGL